MSVLRWFNPRAMFLIPLGLGIADRSSLQQLRTARANRNNRTGTYRSPCHG